MFGYRIEEDFDLAKEQRRDRLIWVVGGGGFCLLVVSLVIHLPMAILQGYFLTLLSYGDSFYVRRKDKLSEPWLWKAILATLPLHVIFLIALIGLDRAFPDFFSKIIVWFPILFVCFGIEGVLFDGIVNRMSSSDTAQPVNAKPD